LATVAATAQQQQGQRCFAVVMNHSTGGGSLGAILIDQCTGKTWVLVRASVARGATAARWFPITVEANEAVSEPEENWLSGQGLSTIRNACNGLAGTSGISGVDLVPS
jgi:hypothetical protein